MRSKAIISIIVLSLISSILTNRLLTDSQLVNFEPVSSYSFTNMKLRVSMEEIENKALEYKISPGTYVATIMSLNKYELNYNDYIKSTAIFNKAFRYMSKFHAKDFKKQIDIYDGLFEDLKVFPVLKPKDKSLWVNYIDSFGNERTYGGNRTHEGTDIMCDEDIAGILPVVSATDGVVTHKGWLELGGYRIGITSDNGIYYYYAHLDSYAEGINEGDRVSAGQLIGFMGNTGYGKTEGTSGKFPVHLHFGIYVYYMDVEIAINPYYLLKNLESKVLYINLKL